MLFSYWNPLNIVRFCSMLYLKQFVRIQATILHISITTMMLINSIILSLYIYHYIIHGHYYHSSICWSKYLPMVYFLFLKYLNIFGHCLEKYVDNPSSQSLKLSWILLMHLSFYCPDPPHPGIGMANAGSFTFFLSESERCPRLSGQYSFVNGRR